MKNPVPNKETFYAESVGGGVKITHHVETNLFGLNDHKIKFFLLPTLKSFHAILGNDSLRDLSAVIYTKYNYMQIRNGMKIRVKQETLQAVNNLNLRTEHMSRCQKESLNILVKKFPKLFLEADGKLTYITNVKGEIRTSTETPVFSKYYPYPMALKNEVEKQIDQLLEDGIIRKSRSPYNSPIWIVSKKPDASGEKKYRLVIDYRKLNTVTIPDRYPIPDINDVLSQLGKNRWFTVLDLKSGFHQIPLKESDIEKTAFSVNHGKYEFTRLPFGLKNAPSIFQRAIDDILREYIGKICLIYIDDIIIFSEDEESHTENIKKIFQTLESANVKIQLDKCEFYKNQVEFLGFIVSADGIKTNPSKVKSILEFPYPKTLRDLRSFLGLSGYYRRFVKDYAGIAKPLTSLLRGEEGRVSSSASRKKAVQLDTEAIEAFEKIKRTLASDDTLLMYPNFNKEFHLTTDASNFAIGAVLEQDNRPITFISRTLSKTEENYATNEKEMLAIVWALGSLRKYLYGSAKVKIFTDHQPLTFSLNNKNHNSKMKRWKSFLEEYNYQLIYKPGKTNIVADALSRAPHPSNVNTMTTTQHSSESSAHSLITTVETPINAFKNQIMLFTGNKDSYEFQIPFPTFHRHVITRTIYSQEDLVQLLKRHLNPSVINGIFTTETIMGKIQDIYPLHFKTYKTRFTQIQVKDITNEAQQEEEILNEHKRAHRNSLENKIQLLQKFYFPKMTSKIKTIVKQCVTCKQHKYDRHPNKPELLATPIPEYPGHIIHVDIYRTDSNLVLTAVDKFSKYAQTRILKSRGVEDVREPLRQILFAYGVPKVIVFDNEKTFNSSSICFMLKDQLGIEIFKTPPYSSFVNGQVERFHSTISEIMRCLKADRTHRSFEELLDRAVYEYNSSIHSTTNRKPIEVFFGRNVSTDPTQFERARQENILRLKEKQNKDLDYHNKTRQPLKNYSPGEVIFAKINRRLGTKLSARFKKEVVKENHPTTILTESGKVIHKANIKN